MLRCTGSYTRVHTLTSEVSFPRLYSRSKATLLLLQITTSRERRGVAEIVGIICRA